MTERLQWQGEDLGSEFEFQWRLMSPGGSELECRLYWNPDVRTFYVCVISRGEVIYCDRTDSPLTGRAKADDRRQVFVNQYHYTDTGLPRTYRLFSGY